MIVAHRGASHDAPENTLPAFHRAWEQGADAIESDLRLTRDGGIVCMHDADTERVAGVRLDVGASTLSELRQLDVGSHHGEAFRSVRVPTLGEMLSTTPEGKRVYLEIKSGAEIIAPLLDEIRASALEPEQLVVIAFDAEVVRTFKSAAPHIKTFWLGVVERGTGGGGGTGPAVDTILDTLHAVGAEGFSSHWDGVTERFIARILECGYEYHVWTIDDAETARRFRDWGAMSITTNRPGWIRNRMDAKA